MSKIADLRENYTQSNLTEAEAPRHPIVLFREWFDHARASNIKEPNAMILSTVDSEGIPHARTVLLKDLSDEGFTFYTNYTSHKAQQMAQQPVVSILFLWKETERQVRITGQATKVDRATTTQYFHSRPRGSQIGAWTSPQSTVIENRASLDQLKAEVEKKFEGVEKIPVPDFWGGYLVTPSKIEFWQGRPSRLHDRLIYSLVEDKNWKIERLAP